MHKREGLSHLNSKIATQDVETHTKTQGLSLFQFFCKKVSRHDFEEIIGFAGVPGSRPFSHHSKTQTKSQAMLEDGA